MSTYTSSKNPLQFLQWFYCARLTYAVRASSIPSVNAYSLQFQFGFPSLKVLFVLPIIVTLF